MIDGGSMDADGLERALAERGCAQVRVAGGSMSPTVAAGAELLVRPGPASLGDVAVIRARGELVVHRLVARLAGRWVHKGDRPGALPGLCRDHEVVGLAELPRRASSPVRRLRWALVALGRALFIVTALTGCKKATPPPPAAPVVVEVRVEDRTPPGGDLPPADVPALTRKAAEVIGLSGLPVVDGSVGPAFRLRVQVRLDGVEDASLKKGVLRAFVEARLAPVGGAPDALSFEQGAVAEHVYEIDKLGDRRAAFSAHALRAVEDVVRGVGARARLSRGSAAELLSALGGSDEDLRDEAARIAGERKEAQAVPALIGLLKSEDPVVRDRAIGALAAVGDRRAVHPLTEVAHFRETSELPKVLDALAAIGGDEAQAYLEFVASGHESPEMRDLAKQALGHLASRTRK